MTTDLTPRACPWCHRGHYINDDDDDRWRVECDTTRRDAAGPWCATEDEAVAEWNRIRLSSFDEAHTPPRPGKRRKRVGRKKAEVAISAYGRAIEEASLRHAPPALSRDRCRAARWAILALMGHAPAWPDEGGAASKAAGGGA